MENLLIHFNNEELLALAKKNFISTCGFELNKEKHQRMMKRAQEVFDAGIHTIDVNALISDYDGSCYNGGTIVINQIEFKCDFFSRIPKKNVKKIYTYLVTVGECWFQSEEDIVNFLYADIWGTAFVDSAINKIENYIKKDIISKYGSNPKCKYILSKPLGPGYYGMPIKTTLDMKKIIDFDKIGVKVKESGLMIPQKSCVGMYMILDDDTIKFPVECSNCFGKNGGCKFCKLYDNFSE